MIGTIAPILMMIGFAALYIELRTPVLVLQLIDLSAWLLSFSDSMVGLADYTKLLLLA